MNAAWPATVCAKPAGGCAQAEAWGVPRDGAHAALGDGGQQRLEVGTRAGVAVYEHDGF